MFNNNKELLNSYSDDFIFLQDVREAYLTHPFTNGKSVKVWFDSFCARLLSVNLVGMVEFLIDAWEEKVTMPKFKALIKTGSVEQISAHTKKLKKEFETQSVTVDIQIIEMFLSIKNFRNALIHSDFNESKLEILKAVSIPSYLTGLGEEIWNSFLKVYKNMSDYINEYAMRKLEIKEEYIPILLSCKTPRTMFRELEMVIEFDLEPTGDGENTGIPKEEKEFRYYFTRKELSHVFWNNIENLADEVLNGRGKRSKIEEKEIINTSLYSWNEYLKNSIENYNEINTDELENVLKILYSIKKKEKVEGITEVYRKSIKLAAQCDKAIINFSVLSLFCSLVNFSKEAATNDLIKLEANKVLQLCKIKLAYTYLYDDHKNLKEISLAKEESIINPH